MPEGPSGQTGSRQEVEAHATVAAARYLEAAFYLESEGQQVRPGRLAEWLGVSPPTVTEALRRMQRDGLITSDPSRRVRLTELGRRVATDVVRRHRVLEVWLTDVLGLDWVEADVEAHRLASALSERVLDALQVSLGNPGHCPHGNAIPGAGEPRRPLQTLWDLRPGATARLSRISELAEHDAPGVLAFLYGAGLVPGEVFTVRSFDPEIQMITLARSDGTLERLPAGVAKVVWVEDIPSAA